MYTYIFQLATIFCYNIILIIHFIPINILVHARFLSKIEPNRFMLTPRCQSVLGHVIGHITGNNFRFLDPNSCGLGNEFWIKSTPDPESIQ